MPPPVPDYLKFANENIVFTARSTDHPGPYQEELFPFNSEILRALSPADPCNTVTLAKGAQTGGTIIATIFALGTMYLDPCDFLYVHPTEENASRWSKQKLSPLLSETTCLTPLFAAGGREGNNSVLYKERIDGRGAIQASSANSPSSLSLISPRKGVYDDLSKWIDNPAGDPEEQAESRSKAFFSRKIFKISTRRVEPGCKISDNFDAGSQEYYHVPCPHKECRHMQPLSWENMKDNLDKDDIDNPFFTCTGCGAAIYEHHRAWMIDPKNGAKWIAKHPERKKVHRSFFMWLVYGPLESWVALARKYFDILAGIEKDGDEQKAYSSEEVFFNDWLGLAYEAHTKAIDWELLQERADETGFQRKVVPAEALALTIGIDCQGDRVEWLLCGHGRNKYRAVIDHGVFDQRTGSHLPGYKEHSGQIAEPEIRQALNKLINQEWVDENGFMRKVDRVAIDGNAYTPDVWAWVRGHPLSKVIMVRGVGHESAPMISQVSERKRNGKIKKRRWTKRFFNFNASACKIALYRCLDKVDPEQTGYIRFAIGLGDEFFKQITSEDRVARTSRSGHKSYYWKVKPGVRNEILDMMNQAFVAAIKHGIFFWTDDQWDQRQLEITKLPQQQQGDLEDLLSAPPVPEAENVSPPASAMTVLQQKIARAKQLAAKAKARTAG